MTIDEAIEHCEEIAQDCELGEKPTVCADEHRQLAEWLRELKEYKTKNQENNEPLTWEELKTMVGKPVYEEELLYSHGAHWRVIKDYGIGTFYNPDGTQSTEEYINYTDDFRLPKRYLNEAFVVYRKEYNETN